MSETGLFVEISVDPVVPEMASSLEDVQGLVMDPAVINYDEAQQLETGVAVIRSDDPQRFAPWQAQGMLWWAVDDELDEIARLRDRWPELQWLPRIEIYKQGVNYHFESTALGEGFKFYIPDTGAINAYLTVVGDRPMEEVLQRAAELGFGSLWLHGAHAEVSGKGLDLDLLERAGRKFEGHIWFSGGASDESHLFNLARQGGAVGVIVPERLIRTCGGERLRLALSSGGDNALRLELEPCSASAPVIA